MAGQSRFISYGMKFPNGIGEFDLGMTTNPRSQIPGVAKIIKHFDNYSDPQKLTPHRSMILDAIDANFGFNDFKIRKMITTSVGIFGFGIIVGQGRACVYQKQSTSPTDRWVAASSGSDASNGGAAGFKLFIEYHKYIYGDNAVGIWKYGDITSSASFTYNDYTSHVPTGQGVVHTLDDILYVPAGNVLLRNNNGSWDVPLSFNASSTIVDICEDGAYLSIMVNQSDGRVVVYQWDRDSSLTTLSAKYDFGYGTGVYVMVIGGILCGVISTAGTDKSLLPHVYFKYVSGTEIKVFQDFNVSAAAFKNEKQNFNNIFYFLAEITLNGEALRGVWKVIKNQKGALIVSFDRLPRNDTLLDSGTLLGFIRWGDYMYVTYLEPTTGLYTLWRTNDQAVFGATSTFETIAFNQILGLRNKRIPDSSIVKKLVGVTLTFEPLPAAAAAGVAYRIEGETNWTLIFSCTTDGAVTHSAINDEVDGTNLRENKEIEFQLLSTGGAEITGFEFTQEIVGKRIY